jgi:hypothetical protein
MISTDFTDDELRTRYREASKLDALLTKHGEVMAATPYRSIRRAIEADASERGLTL